MHGVEINREQVYYTMGYGNYTEERRELFADQTLAELINEIKQRRTRRASNQLPQTETP